MYQQQRQNVPGPLIQGRAAIVAPVSAFSGVIPDKALVVIPVNKLPDEMTARLEEGPLIVTDEQMWRLMGFNGPAVRVTDDEGRPIVIGLEDLLNSLDKQWQENSSELNYGRRYAHELRKYGRLQRAEEVLASLVAKGGTGEDWLVLGISQFQLDKLDLAEGTLNGAAHLLNDNPYPALYLARLYSRRGDRVLQDKHIDKAIAIDSRCLDAWADLFLAWRERENDDKAIAVIEERANDQKNAAPWLAVQDFYSADEATHDKAIAFAEKAVAVSDGDSSALLCLSGLYGQAGKYDKVVELLSKHESKVTSCYEAALLRGFEAA